MRSMQERLVTLAEVRAPECVSHFSGIACFLADLSVCLYVHLSIQLPVYKIWWSLWTRGFTALWIANIKEEFFSYHPNPVRCESIGLGAPV